MLSGLSKLALLPQLKCGWLLADGPRPLLVEALRRLVEEHFRKERLIAFYADKLAITPDRLNDHVKRATGVTAGHLIRQRVLTEAKRQVEAYFDGKLRDFNLPLRPAGSPFRRAVCRNAELSRSSGRQPTRTRTCSRSTSTTVPTVNVHGRC